MYPILLDWGPLTLSSYFVLVSVAFILASVLVVRSARAHGLAAVAYLDLCMVIGVAGLLGARLFHVLVEMPSFYLRNPLAVFKIWYGGFVLYGGVIAATLAGVWYCRIRQLPILPTADLLAPAIVLAIAVGRMGCLLAGCCYGAVCDLADGLPWTLTYQRLGNIVPQATPLGLPLWATQVWESLLCLLLYGVLLMRRRTKAFHGAVAALALIGYSSLRFAVEFFRGDRDRGLYFNESLSTAQLLSLLILVGGVVLHWRGKRSRG